VGAARAAFYPTITLNALLGTVGGGLFGLFGGNAGLDAGAQGLLPVLNGGGLRAGLDGARAARDAERARLELTVQQAFREVADALARQGTIDSQVAAQARLVADADAGVRLTRARYEAGEDDFLDTLVSERALYAARRSLAAARRLRAANRVALYVALGGDARSDDR
jgi:multidrug efflux system outer membrane protein